MVFTACSVLTQVLLLFKEIEFDVIINKHMAAYSSYKQFYNAQSDILCGAHIWGQRRLSLFVEVCGSIGLEVLVPFLFRNNNL